MFYKHRFRVTLNTDNRLMSRTSFTQEYKLAHDVYGLGLNDLERLSINAMKSAFIPYNERVDIIFNVIKPRFAELRKTLALQNEKFLEARA
ncbi:MAG: hypothetical protein RML35_14265 [Chloroherpetonaceae bacterium]|nr:hypothetical protein [Chloroherpetonaceae bacterium]